MLGGREKTFAVVVLLFAVSAVSASPTVISGHPAPSISSSPDRATTVVACNLGPSVAACDQMSELAKALLQPPLSDSRTTAGHCLPAVPPAMAMVLMGFVCISLIRDRKAWLAVLAGLLWIGQTGINALPELTSHLGRKIHSGRLIEPALASPYFLGGGFYPANYCKEIQYTGLLHHLAGIPQQTNVFINKRVPLTWQSSSVAGRDTRVSQHAILSAQFILSKPFDCLVSGTRQFICFTPAFIFCQLPRGPPLSA